jgi:hypothetical protein
VGRPASGLGGLGLMDRELQRAYGRVGGLVTRSRHSDPAAKARLAFEARFYRDMPDGLSPEERDRRAASARQAYFAALTARSVAARRRPDAGLMQNRLVYERVKELWEEHLAAQFPAGYRGEEIAGVDMVLLDAEIAGCISSYLRSRGKLDADRLRITRTCRLHLDQVIPQLNGEAQRYYERLRILSDLVTQSLAQSD